MSRLRPATARQIAPGVQWLRMPLPFALDHINLWALQDGDGGWAAVDTGVQTSETAAAWRSHFALGGALAGARSSRVCSSRTCIPITSAWPAG